MARSSENSPDGDGAQRQGAADAHGRYLRDSLQSSLAKAGPFRLAPRLWLACRGPFICSISVRCILACGSRHFSRLARL
jgi:hypothetical protein